MFHIVDLSIAAVLQILAVMLSHPWKGSNRKTRVLILIIVTLIIASAVWGMYEKRKKWYVEEIQAIIGELHSSGRDSTRVTAIGSGKTKFVYGGPKGTPQFVDSKGNPLWAVTRDDDGKLKLFAVVRNTKGDPVAAIKNNKYTIWDNEFLFNFDDDGFELVTKDGLDVWYQVYFSEDLVHFTGAMLGPDGYGKYMYESATEESAAMAPLTPHNYFFFPPEAKNTLFVYPRSGNEGKRRTY